jgi:hypothetical protein
MNSFFSISSPVLNLMAHYPMGTTLAESGFQYSYRYYEVARLVTNLTVIASGDGWMGLKASHGVG